MTQARLVALIFLTLTACTPRGQIVIDPEAGATDEIVTVFIGTTRTQDLDTREEFGPARSQTTRFARIDVGIPPDHQPGQITWPRPGQKPNRATDFLATRQTIYPNSLAFRGELAAALLTKPRGTREAVVFVHGFNNTFAEGAYRIAQLDYDLGIGSVLVHYSWPSRGHPLAYAYDRDSALFARDGLEDLLHEVKAAGAERIVIVAHSLGAALTMETLRQIAISGDRSLRPSTMGVVLMSPDIDVDVFRAQALRVGKLPDPFVILSSQRDKVLALSARLSGQRDRLGTVTNAAELADLKVTLLDTTAFSKGAGHFNAGNSPALLAVLGRASEVDDAFSGGQTGRTGLLPGAVLTVQNATEIILSPVSTLSGAVR